MKIAGDLYFCEWCRAEFKQKVSAYISPDSNSKGKQNVTSACRCPLCKRVISQKPLGRA